MPEAELERRVEMIENDEFPWNRRATATKAELAALRTEPRAEIQDSVAGAVRVLSAAIAEIRADIKALTDGQRHTTVLVEEVIGRLKTIAEGNPPLSE